VTSPPDIRQSTGLASNSRIKIRAGDKWLYAGASGTGKSFAKRKVVERLMTMYPETAYYALDTGQGDDYDHLAMYRITSDHAPRQKAGEARIQVWSPEIEIPQEIERWIWMVRNDAPAILDIDEALSLHYGGRDVSEEFSRLLKICRKLPVSIHTASQELVKVPRNIIGQANHVLRFGLNHPYEVMLMNAMLKENVRDIPDEHGVWYRSMRGGAARYYKQVQEFLGENK
jgi:hypothetical protein